MPQNYLKAVFWDHPELCDPEGVRRTIDQAVYHEDRQRILWIMARFLERGRVKDTALFFRLEEIRDALNSLKISSRAKKRWERLIEVYGDTD